MKKFNFLAGLFLLAFTVSTFVACKDDEDKTPEPQSIVEIVVDGDDFSDLETALTRADLVSVLEGTGPFTVFAPTNAAFDKAGINVNTIDVATLKNVLLYHVLGGASIKSTDLAAGQTYASTASESGPGDTQLSILIEKTGAAVKVNNTANVTSADVAATNGTIHVIDNVLLPLDVVGHAKANSNFTSLVTSLAAADGGLVAVLEGDGPFTVFAPLNSAFADIAAVTATLTTAQLASVLTYHVVGGNVVAGDLSDGFEPTTVNGQKFKVNINGTAVSLTSSSGNDANVVLTDVQGTNGVIHVLDAVIIPNL